MKVVSGIVTEIQDKVKLHSLETGEAFKGHTYIYNVFSITSWRLPV